MNVRMSIIAPCVVLALLLSGCGPPTKEDLLAKAKDVKTRTELEQALGRADDVSKLGPVEKWTYKAKNGQVVFVIVGESVTFQAAGGGENKP